MENNNADFLYLIALAMPFKIRILVGAILYFQVAIAQKVELSAGGASFIFFNQHDGHVTNTATGNIGWDIDVRYKGFRKGNQKGCIGLQFFNLKTHFYNNYWAGGGAYSEWLKGEMKSVNMGFCWYSFNLAQKKKSYEWLAGFAVNIPLYSTISGRWHKHDYYRTPPYNFEGDIGEKERRQVRVPITFNLITSFDAELFQTKKMNYKLRFKAAINPVAEVLNIGAFRGTLGLVASFPVSKINNRSQ